MPDLVTPEYQNYTFKKDLIGAFTLEELQSEFQEISNEFFRIKELIYDNLEESPEIVVPEMGLEDPDFIDKLVYDKDTPLHIKKLANYFVSLRVERNFIDSVIDMSRPKLEADDIDESFEALPTTGLSDSKKIELEQEVQSILDIINETDVELQENAKQYEKDLNLFEEDIKKSGIEIPPDGLNADFIETIQEKLSDKSQAILSQLIDIAEDTLQKKTLKEEKKQEVDILIQQIEESPVNIDDLKNYIFINRSTNEFPYYTLEYKKQKIDELEKERKRIGELIINEVKKKEF
ncbi:MAG: hypothetical protein ASQ68_gp26 [Yellowstone Lake virophage 6]|uniref:hypothetical protein n=1 Tax=Yellowstone Lake virophage 6 TaxID=1557034 RepID=UPI000536066C|nr:MAG: hypothetical protein ASQ68_gp26 [Yellowstone Lake virophage 6]AIW01916.1 MAG: hypothetical protein YSLV6_ORF26 [Yellowstone Lake virophage 6]